MPLRLTGDLFVPVEFELTYLETCRQRRLGRPSHAVGDGQRREAVGGVREVHFILFGMPMFNANTNRACTRAAPQGDDMPHMPIAAPLNPPTARAAEICAVITVSFPVSSALNPPRHALKSASVM